MFSFASLFASAESALAAIMPVVRPLESVAATLAPAVEALVPASVGPIEAIKAGAAAISAIAPTAMTDTTTAIAAGQKIVADAHPVITELEAIFNSLFHVTPAPGGAVLLTPKTTAPTAAAPLAPAPGNAVS